MGKKKKKYYVVWTGKQPGIYESWEECSRQVQGINGAQYKSFESIDVAQEAFRLGPQLSSNLSATQKDNVILSVDTSGMTVVKPNADPHAPLPEMNALAVDAACSGNPGVMEYQGVFVSTRTQLFHFKAPYGTNNIGEFLAIVHGLAYLKKNRMDLIIYSDSVNAINWVRAKQCRTKLPYNEQSAPLYEIIRRAEAWLHNNTYTTDIRKWDTDLWGEIPADFNRKH